jgi:ribosomal 50S subunit-recycling heat shock protein
MPKNNMKPRRLKHGIVMTGKIYIDGAKVQNVKNQSIGDVITRLQELQDKYA